MCDRLGAPLGDEFFIAPDGRRISPIAQLRPPKFSRARGVALFAKGPIRLLVHRLKYGDGEELARPMGRWMARAGAEILADADLLAPIPLHWTRQWRRGFNQASALAASVSAAAGPPVVHNLLTRRRATPTQTMLPPHLRAANLHNAFGIDAILARTRVEGRNIVLIDDVMTTGATLNAAAETLLHAKAARVDALVFALVRPDSSAEPIAAAAAPS